MIREMFAMRLLKEKHVVVPGTGFGEAVSRVVGGVLATYYLAFFLSVGGVTAPCRRAP